MQFEFPVYFISWSLGGNAAVNYYCTAGKQELPIVYGTSQTGERSPKTQNKADPTRVYS